MKNCSVVLLILVLLLPTLALAQKPAPPQVQQLQGPQNPRLGFVIHGGAGVITRGTLTPQQEKEYRAKLEEAVLAGYKTLQAGRPAMDAVEVAIRILEDSPLFNAGKGAVFTHDGTNELDASVMDGKTLGAGAVAGVRRVKNPITLARAVMEKSEHVMMTGDGAEKFAAERKIELVDTKYFWTQHRWDALQKILKEEKEKRGDVWYPADTIQSAIGQLDNLFTPIQLASYVSTIANKGTRYKLHLIKSAKSYFYGETVFETQPEVVDSFTMQPQNYQAVIDGMRGVIEEGTAAGEFRDFKTPLAGKTGTAEVPNGSATGVFVGFAPIDNPQIAVVVVIEHAGLGANTAPVAKDILSAYFTAKETGDKISPEGVLLK